LCCDQDHGRSRDEHWDELFRHPWRHLLRSRHCLRAQHDRDDRLVSLEAYRRKRVVLPYPDLEAVWINVLRFAKQTRSLPFDLNGEHA
jgi:hypothetical protein